MVIDTIKNIIIWFTDTIRSMSTPMLIILVVFITMVVMDNTIKRILKFCFFLFFMFLVMNFLGLKLPTFIEILSFLQKTGLKLLSLLPGR